MKNKINYFNLFVEFLKMKKKKALLLDSYSINEENSYKNIKTNFLEISRESEFLKEKSTEVITLNSNGLVDIPEYENSCAEANFIKFSRET